MPLKTGYSRETFEHNYAQMKREGHPHTQALAAAFKEARKSFFDRYPHGALPQWLTPKDGKRMKNPCEPCERKQNPLTEKIQWHVDHLLQEYQQHGKTAAEQLFQDIVQKYRLTVAQSSALSQLFQEAANLTAHKRKQNPVPPSRKLQQRNAEDLYSRFTGHEATEHVMIDKPVLPDVMLVVGDIDFIGYTTVRDGVTEKYIHKFKKNCRPLFTVSHDGKLLFMLGGSYDFTELGIVDRT